MPDFENMTPEESLNAARKAFLDAENYGYSLSSTGANQDAKTPGLAIASLAYGLKLMSWTDEK